MRMCCSLCPPGTTYDEGTVYCPEHIEALVPCAQSAADIPAETPAAAPDPPPEATPSAGGTAWERATCWNCGTGSLNPANTECLSCGSSLVPPRLVLTVTGGARSVGTIQVGCGGSALLGRSGPEARLFERFGNVSREHARVGVDDDGTAWVEPLPTPNGTFHGPDFRELPAHTRLRLADRDTLRLARNVTLGVVLYALPDI